MISLRFCSLILLCSLMIGCASNEDVSLSSHPLADNQANAASSEFTLSAGDSLRITVFGDDSLSGDYDVSAGGKITMPLIGEIQAAGKSVDTLKSNIIARLDRGLIVNPRVNIDVTSLRPFYIRGEVRQPGSYPTFPDFDIFKAIATAGGLTPRAVKGKYIIYRGSGEDRREIPATDETPVLPGDSIRVKERFF